MSASVSSVHRSSNHSFSKEHAETIELVAGLGVVGDAHQGAQVRDRSRVAADPTQPNLRQVHLIHEELFSHMADAGFTVGPGELGENITTQGIELLDLPVGAVLKLGSEALIAVTGLRNPCAQIDAFQDGLLNTVLFRHDEGSMVRLAGIMGVVVAGGVVSPRDTIEVSLPPPPFAVIAISGLNRG